MGYVNKVRNKWDNIWNFCTKTEVLNLKMDSYIHKKKAVNRIAKEIVKSVKDKRNIYPRHQNVIILMKKYTMKIRINLYYLRWERGMEI